MKKMLPFFLALLLLLSSCGGGSTSKPFDPAGATQALIDSGAFSLPLDEVDVKLLYDFSAYGLDETKLTDAKAYLASGFAEQVSVTVWKTEADAKAAVKGLQAYLADIKVTNKDYAPAEIEKINNAIVSVSGTSVLLIVPADADAAKQAIERLG